MSFTEQTAIDGTRTANLQDLIIEIKQRALTSEFDNQAFISEDIIQKFKEIGIYRALVPKRFGGDGVSPTEFCELIEKISMADGSAGWVASFGMSPIYLGGLPVETLTKIYKESPDVIFAGGIFPPQPATREKNGYRINGRWRYSSGCKSATLFGVGFIPQKNDNSFGLPHTAVIPAEDVVIEDNWDMTGLKGTGSHDIIVKDAFVADDWVFVRGNPSVLEEPFFRFPALSFATQVLCVVGLGVARAAIDHLISMSEGSKSITGAPGLGDRPLTQYQIAQAEAQLQSARSWFYETMNSSWQTILKGDPVSKAKINAMRLACTHASRVSADVTRLIQIVSGMAGVHRDNPLSRYVNDANVITQHAFMGEFTYQNAGSMLFGNNPGPGYL